MFDFEFEYKDERTLVVNSVEEVIYYIAGMKTVVSGEKILTYQFPLTADFQLIGNNCNYSVSHDGLLMIRIARSD